MMIGKNNKITETIFKITPNTDGKLAQDIDAMLAKEQLPRGKKGKNKEKKKL